MLTICIGHDYREQEAYEVCAASIRRRTAQDVNIVRLQEREMRDMGVYNRPYHVDEGGQFWDDRDGRPFSVAFSFARFLTPLMARGHGQARGWALFVDCDFLFLRDVGELFALADANKAVMVVKHVHQPPGGVKMDGMAQLAYRRKNWSSCILWNLDHPANDALTPRSVNTMPGRWLHGFDWLPDELIGELPETWNWLVGASPTTESGSFDGATPGAIHYTGGGPWFANAKDCEYAELWTRERDHMKRVEAFRLKAA